MNFLTSPGGQWPQLWSNLVCLHNPADCPALPSRSSSWQKNLDPEIKDSEQLLMSEKLLAGITNSHTPACILYGASTEYPFNDNAMRIEITILFTVKMYFWWNGRGSISLLYSCTWETTLSLSLSLHEADYFPPSCAKFTISGALLPDLMHLHGMCFSPRLKYSAYNFIWPTDTKILKCKHCCCNTYCCRHWASTCSPHENSRDW